jgi:hypothetical protein
MISNTINRVGIVKLVSIGSQLRIAWRERAALRQEEPGSRRGPARAGAVRSAPRADRGEDVGDARLLDPPGIDLEHLRHAAGAGSAHADADAR